MSSRLVPVEMDCKAFLSGRNQIFYYYNEELDGIFILWLKLRYKPAAAFFLEFVDKFKNMDIYFSTDDPSYIRNHIEFYGYYGDKKVYKYVK